MVKTEIFGADPKLRGLEKKTLVSRSEAHEQVNYNNTCEYP